MARSPRAAPRKIPRATFWIGSLAGLALTVPLISVAFRGLAVVFDVGDAKLGLDRLIILSAVFAGLPAWLTGGGVARLVAHRMAERAPVAETWAGIRLGTRAMAVAGLGFAFLVAVPAGALSEQRLRWIPLLIAGVAVGALTGAAIGVLIALRQKRHDVVADPADV